MATEETISESNELAQACASSLLARSKLMRARTWLRKWKRERWTRFLSGRIVKPSRAKSFADWWTSSLPATRAKASVRRVSAKELAILASYGLGLSGQQSLFAPAEFFLRTLRATSRLDSPQSSVTWKKQVIEQRGDYLARLKLAHRTNENGSLSWATPEAKNQNGYQISSGKKFLRLGAQVAEWLTPTAHDCRVADAPGSRNYERKTEAGWSLGLNHQVNWPTPNATDGTKAPKYHKSGKSSLPHLVRTGQLDRESLSMSGNRRGQLNPDWVETLMGLPIGWTGYACAGTEWFQTPQRELGSRCPKG